MERTVEQTIEYPVRDGRPMGESDEHRDEMQNYAIDLLDGYFSSDPTVYVSGNNFIYYSQGIPTDCVSPDAYVVRGVPKKKRDVYKMWEEGGRTPCFALEVTSRSTRSEDLGPKMSKYRDDLKVAEYFLFDLRGEWIRERLRGFRLVGEVYQPIVANAAGRLESGELGLELGVRGEHLRFFRSGAEEPLPTDRECAQQERERAQRAEARAERAEQELARLREELKRLRGGA